MTFVHNPELLMPEEVLPHRPPILWVDGVTDIHRPTEDGDVLVVRGFWTPLNEYDGHFPNAPMLPGHYQAEALAQLGAYALMHDQTEASLPVLRGSDSEFTGMVRPGQTLEMEVTFLEQSARTFRGKGVARVGGKVVCQSLIKGSIMSSKLVQRMIGVELPTRDNPDSE